VQERQDRLDAQAASPSGAGFSRLRRLCLTVQRDFFLDGKEFWRHPKPRERDAPLYPIVNLALGSGWPIDKTPDPSVL
jgi:hypothetical protein